MIVWPFLLCIGALCINAIPAVHEIRSCLRGLNRILERRQMHEYETDQSYRRLLRLEFPVQPTKVIAGHFRQLRRLCHDWPDEKLLQEHLQKEKVRMEGFVNDINQVNLMTQYALYYRYGDVKDRTFDDLNGFIMNEIEFLRRALQKAEGRESTIKHQFNKRQEIKK